MARSVLDAGDDSFPPYDPAGAYSIFLSTLQHEVGSREVERGTYTETVSHKSLLMAEELFEIVKILRVRAGIATSCRTDGRSGSDLSDELADLVFVTAAVANRVSVKLDQEAGRWLTENSGYVPCSTDDRGDQGPDSEHFLQLALALSREVLTVMACTDAHPAECDADLRLGNALGKIVVLVGDLATYEGISISDAMSRKLMKDQHRLWVSAAPR